MIIYKVFYNVSGICLMRVVLQTDPNILRWKSVFLIAGAIMLAALGAFFAGIILLDTFLNSSNSVNELLCTWITFTKIQWLKMYHQLEIWSSLKHSLRLFPFYENSALFLIEKITTFIIGLGMNGFTIVFPFIGFFTKAAKFCHVWNSFSTSLIKIWYTHFVTA